MIATTDPAQWRRFLTHRMPWWVGAGGLLIYLGTLNGWISFSNLGAVARVSGWVWQPQLQRPLTAAVQFPFGLLPERWIPLALNLFSAVLASLVLIVLARSVALLRHDVASGKNSEPNPGSLLILPHAWIPQVLAALVCGLQLTFWEHATSWTGEMLNLLLFAYVIRCLLEYRFTREKRWIYRCGLVFGAGMANHWAMVGYLPVLLAALLWITSFQILYDRLCLLRWLACGFAGLSFYLFLPTLASFSGHADLDFWSGLKANLKNQKEALAFLKRPAFRVLALTSLLPLFVVSIRWKSHTVQSTDDSKLGVFLTRFTVHFVHALFFCIALWIALDPNFSPRNLNLGVPMLSYYYLSALVAGYGAGYLLLMGSGRRPRTVAKLSHAAVWVALCSLPFLLLWRNLGQVTTSNGPATRQLARQLYSDLPAGKSVVLGDDPEQLFLLQAAAAGHAREKQPLLVETRSLGVATYHRFMARRFPERWPRVVLTNGVESIGPLKILNLVSRLHARETVGYIDPGFGLLLERFESRPHGLIARLQPRPRPHKLKDSSPESVKTEQAVAAKETTSDLAGEVFTGEQAWQKRWTDSIQAIVPHKPAAAQPRFFAALRLAPYENRIRSDLARLYSKALNGWGVHLRRLGFWEQSRAWFERAVILNQDNLAAQINLEYNRRSLLGDTNRLQGDWLEAHFHHLSSKYANWLSVLGMDGPVDEPTILAKIGRGLFEARNYYQAMREYQRCQILAPDWLEPKPWLALTYLNVGQFERALSAADSAGPAATADPATYCQLLVCRTTALQGLGRTNDARACLESFIADPGRRNEVLFTAANLYEQNLQFEPALIILDHLLEREPNDLTILTKKGRVELELSRYEAAVATLGKVSARLPLDEKVRLSLAIARLGAGQLDEAQSDYQELLKTTKKPKNALFGLGSIAWRKQQTNQAIELYQQYLSTGIPGSPQYAIVSERLSQLKGLSPTNTATR